MINLNRSLEPITIRYYVGHPVIMDRIGQVGIKPDIKGQDRKEIGQVISDEDKHNMTDQDVIEQIKNRK